MNNELAVEVGLGYGFICKVINGAWHRKVYEKWEKCSLRESPILDALLAERERRERAENELYYLRDGTGETWVISRIDDYFKTLATEDEPQESSKHV